MTAATEEQVLDHDLMVAEVARPDGSWRRVCEQRWTGRSWPPPPSLHLLVGRTLGLAAIVDDAQLEAVTQRCDEMNRATPDLPPSTMDDLYEVTRVELTSWSRLTERTAHVLRTALYRPAKEAQL